jgi:hypothetical protein
MGVRLNRWSPLGPACRSPHRGFGTTRARYQAHRLGAWSSAEASEAAPRWGPERYIASSQERRREAASRPATVWGCLTYGDAQGDLALMRSRFATVARPGGMETPFSARREPPLRSARAGRQQREHPPAARWGRFASVSASSKGDERSGWNTRNG